VAGDARVGAEEGAEGVEGAEGAEVAAAASASSAMSARAVREAPRGIEVARRGNVPRKEGN